MSKKKVTSQQQLQTQMYILLVDEDIDSYIDFINVVSDISLTPGFRNPLLPHQPIIKKLKSFNTQMFPS